MPERDCNCNPPASAIICKAIYACSSHCTCCLKKSLGGQLAILDTVTTLTLRQSYCCMETNLNAEKAVIAALLAPASIDFQLKKGGLQQGPPLQNADVLQIDGRELTQPDFFLDP